MVQVSLLHASGLRCNIVLLVLIAMTTVMTKTLCFSFQISTHASKKSLVVKKPIVYNRPYTSSCKWHYAVTRLFSSSSPSDATTNPTSARSPTFAIQKRIINQEESRKYDEMIGASKLQLAPMMEYTDRHFRHLIRLISGKTLLYTEMVAANALAHERATCIEEYEKKQMQTSSTSSAPSIDESRKNYSDQYLLRFLKQGQIQPLEGPSVLQLGGSDPKQLYEAAQTVMDMVRSSY